MCLQLLLRIQRKHLNNVTCIFVAFFPLQIQTVAGRGYYGIESPLRYMRNLKTRLFFGASKVPLVGCQEPLVVKMASNEATIITHANIPILNLTPLYNVSPALLARQ